MYMGTRLNINGFFTIPVLQKKIENMEDFNKSIVDNIDVFMKENENKKPVNWSCELYVSGIHDNLLNRKEFRELKKPILENAKVLCEHMDYDLENYRLKIRDCWLNAYEKGNTQETHNHPGSDISGIYYPTSNELDGPLVFKSPIADVMKQPPLKKLSARNTPYIYVRTETSNMVMFPSHLMHGVMPQQDENKRISIAFNIELVKK